METDLFSHKLENMRQQITRELDQLETEENSLKKRQGTESLLAKEEAVRATNDLERSAALKERKRKILTEIEHALVKIRAGSYGICDSCGQPINHGRLEVLPYASQCIKCKGILKKTFKK